MKSNTHRAKPNYDTKSKNNQHLDRQNTKNISEDTQEMPKSRSTAFPWYQMKR